MELEKLIEPDFNFAQPQEEIDVKEVVDEEKRELQLSTISQHLSEKSEVKPRISQAFMDDHEVVDQDLDVVQIASKSKPDEPIVSEPTSIAMTRSSWKSTLVPQFFETDEAEKSEVSCLVHIINFYGIANLNKTIFDWKAELSRSQYLLITFVCQLPSCFITKIL